MLHRGVGVTQRGELWKAVIEVVGSGQHPAPAENSFEGGNWQASLRETVNLQMVRWRCSSSGWVAGEWWLHKHGLHTRRRPTPPVTDTWPDWYSHLHPICSSTDQTAIVDT